MISTSTRSLAGRVVACALLFACFGWADAETASSTPAMSKPATLAAPVAQPPMVGTPVNDPALKKSLETRIGATIDSITRLPVASLLEIRIGDDVFYADPTGNYIVVGNLIDLRSRENLTRKRVEAIKEASMPKVVFAELPFDSAVKVVRGSGKRQVAIFEDPNCVYCKRLEKAILDVGDVTIYVFLFPVLGPDSLAKSRQVWCATDRAKAWTDWMQSGTALTGEGACPTPLDKNLEMGKKLKVEGTPTLFFSNNKRVEGTIDQAELERLLGAGA